MEGAGAHAVGLSEMSQSVGFEYVWRAQGYLTYLRILIRQEQFAALIN